MNPGKCDPSSAAKMEPERVRRRAVAVANNVFMVCFLSGLGFSIGTAESNPFSTKK